MFGINFWGNLNVTTIWRSYFFPARGASDLHRDEANGLRGLSYRPVRCQNEREGKIIYILQLT